MFHILLVSALPAELKIIKQEVKKLTLKNMKVSFFAHGMGNYETILHLSKHLQEHSYDFIVNIGVCGYRQEKRDLIQIARSYNPANQKETLIPIFSCFADLESILCSERVVYEAENLGKENYVDMESYGFEKVCENYKIPRMSLKVPVDKVGEETKNFDFERARLLLQKNINYEKLCENIRKFLEKNPKKEDLTFYKTYFCFTVSEQVIFEKFYYKYTTLIEKDFRIFFEANKTKNKKQFLEDLKTSFIGLSI